MTMQSRQNSYAPGGEQYRYAYNGMEQDEEVSDAGNSYTTEFRQYDPRLGRWKSLDPLMAKFPWQSPYCAFDDNPVFYVDPLGLEGEPKNKKPIAADVRGTSGQVSSFCSTCDPSEYEGRPLNPDINDGAGDPSMPGAWGAELTGRRFILADERISNGEYINKPKSTVWSIAKSNGRTPDQIRKWNKGLNEETQDKIGQGQKIYIDPPMGRVKQAREVASESAAQTMTELEIREKLLSKGMFEYLQGIFGNLVGMYTEGTGGYTGGGDATGELWTMDGWNNYTTTSQGFNLEAAHVGIGSGWIFSTGDPKEVPLSAFSGGSWSVDGSVSLSFFGVGLVVTKSDPYNRQGDYLIGVGVQVDVGISTPGGTGGVNINETTIR